MNCLMQTAYSSHISALDHNWLRLWCGSIRHAATELGQHISHTYLARLSDTQDTGLLACRISDQLMIFITSEIFTVADAWTGPDIVKRMGSDHQGDRENMAGTRQKEGQVSQIMRII